MNGHRCNYPPHLHPELHRHPTGIQQAERMNEQMNNQMGLTVRNSIGKIHEPTTLEMDEIMSKYSSNTKILLCCFSELRFHLEAQGDWHCPSWVFTKQRWGGEVLRGTSLLPPFSYSFIYSTNRLIPCQAPGGTEMHNSLCNLHKPMKTVQW